MDARKRLLTTIIAALVILGACSSSNEKPNLDAAPPVKEKTETPATNKCGDPTDPDTNLVANGKEAVPTVNVYQSPVAAEPISTLSYPLLYNGDPNAPLPLVLLVKDAPETNCAWLEVYLAQRPNGSTGWIKRADVDVSSHTYRMEAHLADFKLDVFKNGEKIGNYDIAVATEDTPTPGGLFFTNMLLQPPDPDGDYGPYAYGLSGYSEKLTSFNGGDGQLGIHGTNQPDKIGTRVSHGCIRLRNDDITKLALELPLGVPVQVYA